MSKGTMISIRTTEEFSDALKALAARNGTTLSGLVNSVLGDYLDFQGGKEILQQDRRRFPRLHKPIPALVTGLGEVEKKIHPCKITNLSLGGINLLVPKNGHGLLVQRRHLDDFGLVFSLPQSRHPIFIQCQAQRIQHHRQHYQIGASFDDADLPSYQALHAYLS